MLKCLGRVWWAKIGIEVAPSLSEWLSLHPGWLLPSLYEWVNPELHSGKMGADKAGWESGRSMQTIYHPQSSGGTRQKYRTGYLDGWRLKFYLCVWPSLKSCGRLRQHLPTKYRFVFWRRDFCSSPQARIQTQDLVSSDRARQACHRSSCFPQHIIGNDNKMCRETLPLMCNFVDELCQPLADEVMAGYRFTTASKRGGAQPGNSLVSVAIRAATRLLLLLNTATKPGIAPLNRQSNPKGRS